MDRLFWEALKIDRRAFSKINVFVNHDMAILLFSHLFFPSRLRRLQASWQFSCHSSPPETDLRVYTLLTLEKTFIIEEPRWQP